MLISLRLVHYINLAFGTTCFTGWRTRVGLSARANFGPLGSLIPPQTKSISGPCGWRSKHPNLTHARLFRPIIHAVLVCAPNLARVGCGRTQKVLNLTPFPACTLPSFLTNIPLVSILPSSFSSLSISCVVFN